MLARSGALPTTSGWSFELKWDGFRALVSTEDGLRDIWSEITTWTVRWVGEFARCVLLGFALRSTKRVKERS